MDQGIAILVKEVLLEDRGLLTEDVEWRVLDDIGHMSETLRIKIKLKTKERKTNQNCIKMKTDDTAREGVVINALLKRIPPSAAKRAFLSGSLFYKTEIKMYREILPALEKPTKEKLWPKFYAARDFDTIIMEDLCTSGYAMSPSIFLDFNHARLAFANLGRLHGAGILLLRENKSCGLGSYCGKEPASYVNIVRPLILAAIQTLANEILENWSSEWRTLGEALFNLDASDALNRFINAPLDPNLVTIIHGDYRASNMLFKYSHDDTPVSVKMVDFQVSCEDDLGQDIGYLVSISLKNDTLERIDELIDVYYEGLTTVVPNPPSLESVRNHFSAKRGFGFLMSIPVGCVVGGNFDSTFYFLSEVSEKDSAERYICSESKSTRPNWKMSPESVNFFQEVLQPYKNDISLLNKVLYFTEPRLNN